MLKKYLHNTQNYLKFQTKEIHLNKFQKFKKLEFGLGERNNQIKEKWVVNLSKYKQLTKEKTSVLEKSLNFAIAPRSIPISTTIASCEKGLLNIKNTTDDELTRSIRSLKF